MIKKSIFNYLIKDNIMIINTTGALEKLIIHLNMKVINYPFGDFLMKNKEKKMLLQFVGILDILIYLP
jgi:hypothetical protein